jgi:hypothetical protein
MAHKASFGWLPILGFFQQGLKATGGPGDEVGFNTSGHDVFD